MKNIKFTLLGFFMFGLGITISKAQSCPTVNSYAIYKVADNGDGTCNYTLQVCYTTSGNKSIRVVVNCNGTQIINQCLQVNGTNCQSINFTCSCDAVISGTLTPWSGGNCNGASCTPTPILNPTIFQLISFNEKLIKLNNRSFLHWGFSTSFSIEEYGVEFCESGNNFSTITDAASGITVTDELIVTQTGFYRIFAKLNGKKVYSKIIPVKINSPTLSVYPNPANQWIQITGLDQQAKIRIYAVYGKLFPGELSSQQTVNISSLPNGVYYIHIIEAQKTTVLKFIKMDL